MHWYQWMALVALGFCVITCLFYFLRLIRLGKPQDLSKPAAKTGPGILFAFTGAMSPARKESALLHLPTYTAGIFYHLGTFLSIFLFFFIIAGAYPSGYLAQLIMFLLSLSSLSGISILIKRLINGNLRSLSNPDDYLSNVLVTLFQAMTLFVMLSASPFLLFKDFSENIQMLYYLIFTILALYVPAGKLRHAVYFFAARYHLGFFYGRRGVWPAGKMKN